MLIQLIIQMVCISFDAISITVTRIGVPLIWGGFSLLFPAVTSMVGICPSELSVYLNIKQETFYLTFKVFIFTRCMDIIHLSLSVS